MRVAILSYNARAHDAIGNHVAETAAFFQERGAAVQVFVQSTQRLHPALRTVVQPVDRVERLGPVWEYLAGADLVIAQFSQACDLLHYLPLLAGRKARLLIDYHGITPPELWTGPNRELLEQGLRQRGIVWCADAAIAHSTFTSAELAAATCFPGERIYHLSLVVDRTRFKPGASRFLQRRLGLDGVQLLLYVGRLAGNKRVPLLIEALEHLPDSVHAVVIGDTSDVYALEAQRCRDRARELGVAGRLHLMDQLPDEDLAEAYRSADVFVMPSRHEGFCVPVIEAMACGLPVVASRAAALPETLGDAGLTFVPDDAVDLARQVARVLKVEDCRAAPRSTHRVAVVCFRFGSDVIGGAETSLRTIARILHDAGHQVEVFTTCTRSESDWHNELPAGSTRCDGLLVHRFPIDPHDREAHLESVRVILEAQGSVSSAAAADYLRHSIHSTALVQSLQARAAEFDAVIAGPYLFGLTFDVAQAFPDKTLLLPCFHDEPVARLAAWPKAYGAVGGFLLHSAEERELMFGKLGINGVNVIEVGTCVPDCRTTPASMQRDYLVYCGRFSRQKNLPLLLDWMRQFQARRPGRFDLVCMGAGEVPMPAEPWLHNLGRVDEDRKHAVLAGARALVQLSCQESLSLVALEAWGQATPVIAHAGCAVLAGQVQRSGGGVAVADYEAFARALDGLADGPGAWRVRGRQGRAYIETCYALRDEFLARLQEAIGNLALPLRVQMQRQGVKRAATCDRAVWRVALGRIVDEVLDRGPRPHRPAVIVQPHQDEIHAHSATRTLLVAVRVANQGTHAIVADGPGRTVLVAVVRDLQSGAIVGTARTELPGLMVPGTAQSAMVTVPVPAELGTYALHIGAEGFDPAHLRLHVGDRLPHRSGLVPLLDEVRDLLARARDVQQLPDTYVDITEGRLARWKRWVKQKLLHNFKRAYVDVLSRQQSQVNRQLVTAVQQLAECCATLDHAVRTLQAQLDQVETGDQRSRYERIDV
jgi:glycosyltransferase involved in cell wall biosynthesis